MDRLADRFRACQPRPGGYTGAGARCFNPRRTKSLRAALPSDHGTGRRNQVERFARILHGILRTVTFVLGCYVIFHLRGKDQNAAALADLLGVAGLLFLLWVWGEAVRGRWR